MPFPWFEKDPDDVLDAGFEVKGFADGDVIESQRIVAQTGSIVVVKHAGVEGLPNETKTRIMGGADGEQASITFRTLMTSGQQVDATLIVTVKTR